MVFPLHFSVPGYVLIGLIFLNSGMTLQAQAGSSSDLEPLPLYAQLQEPSGELGHPTAQNVTPPSPSGHHGNFFFSPTFSPKPSAGFSENEPKEMTAPAKVISSEGESSNHEDIPLMAETVVEGSSPDFDEDPFDDPFEEEGLDEVYDPWEGFNSTMFDFNYNLDKYFFKPVATGYGWIIPPDAQDSIANAFKNVGFVPRFMNSLFQGKMSVAGIELQRFLINSTIGVGGFFDVAKYVFEIEAPDGEDTGQTLATYGVGSGPYLVLPLLGPTTVRDGFGQLGDAALNPLNYFVPFVPNISSRAGNITNERSRNLDLFEGLEESTIDLYGAVRSGYFEKRSKAIQK